MEEIKNLVDLFSISEKLKYVVRFKDTPQMEKKESSADHSWKMTFFVFTLSKQFNLEIDLEKSLKMAIVHDLGEIFADNIDYNLVAEGKVSAEQKAEKEREGVEKLKDLGNSELVSEIYSLLKEYEDGNSEEAKFVRAVSKLETLDHLLNYGYECYSMPESIPNYADKAVSNFPVLIPILEELKKRLKEEFAKGGIEWISDYDLIKK